MSAPSVRCEVCELPICCTAKTRERCRMMSGWCHGGGGHWQLGYERQKELTKKLADALAALVRGLPGMDDVDYSAPVEMKKAVDAGRAALIAAGRT